MKPALARLFRNLNARLIYTDNVVVEKVLKMFFWISVVVYRKERKKKISSLNVVIDNFDSNVKMVIDPSRSMGSAIYWTGYHEFREFLFLHRFLRPDMVFIDVGANQGEYSLFAAKRLTKGRVVAFEPLPSIRSRFEENIRLNKFSNIKIIAAGLSDKKGTLEIHEVEDEHEGLATFFLGDRKSKKSFEVPLVKLDEIADGTEFSRIDFIKIDIEGGELNALRGAQNTIRRFKPAIMLEINEETYLAAGYRTQDILDILGSSGYQPFEIRKVGRLAPVRNLPPFGNFVFLPK